MENSEIFVVGLAVGILIGAFAASSPCLQLPTRILLKTNVFIPTLVVLLAFAAHRTLSSQAWITAQIVQSAFGFSASELNRLAAVLQKVTPFEVTAIPVAIEVASNLGVLDFAGGSNPVKVAEVARAANITVDGARCILEVLSYAGLLDRDAKGRFHHQWSKQALDLVSQNARFVASVEMPVLLHLEEALRTGQASGLRRVFGNYTSIYRARVKIPKLAAWTDMMNNGNRLAFAAMSKRYEKVFSRVGQLLDLCGNEGQNAFALAARYPSMRITIHDLPAVINDPERGTAVRIRQAGREGQVSTFPWDLATPGEIMWPRRDFDMVQLVHCVNEWPRDEFKRRLNQITLALRPGGVVMIVGSFVFKSPNNDIAGRSWLMMPYFLSAAQDGGTMYDAASIQSLVSEAGFIDAKIEHLWETLIAISGTRP